MANRKRTKEERITEIDNKIKFCESKITAYQEQIKTLNEKKENILNPKPRTRKTKPTFNSIAKIAKENGMSIDEFANKLGITIPEEQ